MKIKMVTMLLVVLMLVPYVVAAQTGNPCVGGSGNLGKCMSQIYLWSIGISGLLAVGALVWGSYLIMTSRGNGAQASTGKSYIYSALMGMVLLLGAYILLNTINTDLTNFDVPNLKLMPNNTQPRN